MSVPLWPNDPNYPDYSEPEYVVDAQMKRLDDLLDGAKEQFNDAMAELRDTFSDKAAPPTADVSYDYVDGDDLNIDLGPPPDVPDMDTNINIPDDPQLRGEILTPQFDEIEEFTARLDDPPAVDIDFDEDYFNSLIWNDLKAIVRTILNAGGTGLPEATEDAIWDRARDRNRIQDEQQYQEVENYFASRGYELPPGIMAKQLAQLRAEQGYRDEQLSDEIAIKQAELAQTNDQFIKNLSHEIVKTDMAFHNAVQDRALQRAMAVADTFRQMYLMKVEGYKGKVDVYRARVDAASAKVQATAAYNKSITDTFTAETDALRAKVNAELGIVELIAKKYMTQMTGYEAQARVATAELGAKVEKYKAEVQQSTNQTELSLKEAEYLLQVYLKSLELDENLSADRAKLWASFITSIFTSISVSAGLTDSDNHSHNETRERGYGGYDKPNASISLSGSLDDL